MATFDSVEEPDEATKAAIHEILRAYNREHFEILDEREFSITAKDDDGAVIGGVYGTMFGQWLEVEVLAVAPGHRGQGLGSDLLSRIEQAGREHGCRYALLNTFDFQGRDFYPKYGYRQIGEIQGYPLTGSQHWFVKDLRRLRLPGSRSCPGPRHPRTLMHRDSDAFPKTLLFRGSVEYVRVTMHQSPNEVGCVRRRWRPGSPPPRRG